ncbi:hypothetical protein EDD18DRAFT_1356198 [Armillaria luteobubalina]|uniref:Uncharacterized protein n=1 Tax=Armillaria luteobubalina TaxID=153913 RepID=A0AA39UUS1_9AGAR|nr:hypothetical protein EDD18DRAFT_1356198 [Armillaria luteobubalina]
MATQTDIPSDLIDDEKTFIFQFLDARLNSEILYALLYGIYTGLLAVTLWNIFINKCWLIRRAVVVVIIFLYALISINFAASWSCAQFAFIKHGQNFWTIYLILEKTTPTAYWVMEVVGSLSTILADLYIIWCCWIIWSQQWLVVLLPILSLVSAVESSALYSVSTILDLAFTIHGDSRLDYFDAIAGMTKGIAPTLLIGRAAAGHTQPREESDGSTVSSLHFQTLSEHSMTSSQNDESTIQSSIIAMDIEAQPEQQVISSEQDTIVSPTSEVIIVR